MNETFIIGKDKFPIWFNDEAMKGRAKVNRDDEGNILNVIIYGAAKNVVANVGDSIIRSKTGLLVIPKEKAKKYNVQPKGSNSES